MRSENTFGVRYAIRQNKNKRKDYSVFARIACNNSPERELTIKGSFPPEDWDEGKGWPHLRTKELREFATHLEKLKSKLTAIFQESKHLDGRYKIVTSANFSFFLYSRPDNQVTTSSHDQ